MLVLLIQGPHFVWQGPKAFKAQEDFRAEEFWAEPQLSSHSVPEQVVEELYFSFPSRPAQDGCPRDLDVSCQPLSYWENQHFWFFQDHWSEKRKGKRKEKLLRHWRAWRAVAGCLCQEGIMGKGKMGIYLNSETELQGRSLWVSTNGLSAGHALEQGRKAGGGDTFKQIRTEILYCMI